MEPSAGTARSRAFPVRAFTCLPATTLPGRRCTPANESAKANGDYLAVQSPARGGQGGNDRILRNTSNNQNSPKTKCESDWLTQTNNSQWTLVSSFFPAKKIGALVSSGGHTSPT